MLGTPVSMPVIVAPVAFQGLVDPDGERASARAAAAAGTIFTLSTMILDAEEGDRLPPRFALVAKVWAWLALDLQHWPDFVVAMGLAGRAAYGFRIVPLQSMLPHGYKVRCRSQLGWGLVILALDFGAAAVFLWPLL